MIIRDLVIQDRGNPTDAEITALYLAEVARPGAAMSGDIKPMLMWLIRKELERSGMPLEWDGI